MTTRPSGTSEPTPDGPADEPTGDLATWEVLFDDLIELSPEERGQRLEQLRSSGAEGTELAARLERLLAADAGPVGLLDQTMMSAWSDGEAGLGGLGGLGGLDGARAEGGAGGDVGGSAGSGGFGGLGGSRGAGGTGGGTGTGDDFDLLPPPPPPQLAEGTIVGPWRVGRLIGRGGMSEVYLAERADGAFAQKAALKVIKAGLDSEAIVRRFMRERQILASLDHPNLAHLLDGGVGPDGRPYFALEWVDGEAITTYCRNHQLDLSRRLRLMQTVCRAVDAAHRRLVVHRDLKPDNILVTGDGTVKLLDFGIAKLLEDDDEPGLALTHVGIRLLTPAYASPEQILGEPITTASDVYSLGVLLYELITGSLPHRRGQRTLHELASAVVNETVERPSAVLRRAGADTRLTRGHGTDLDLIVLTALHRDPLRRYTGALALADDLGNLLSGLPIRARPNELGYRLRRFVGRHRIAVGAVAAALVALVAALVVSVRQADAARAAARRAERVKSFLISIFNQSDPVQTDGSRLTARELLARGALSLDRELAGEPEVQADLLDAVARIETSLSLLPEATAHARRALALRRASLDRADGRIGISWTVLAEALAASGADSEANQDFHTALALLVPAYGAGSVEVAEARRGLAGDMADGQGAKEAIALLVQARAAFVSRLGETHLESIDTLQELGRALEWNQQYAESEAAYRRALALYIQTLGPHNVRVAVTQGLLASLLDRVGRRAEARPLYRTAIAEQRALLGPRHRQLAKTLINYGLNLLGDQDYDEADAALREALAIETPGDSGYAQCLRYLGLSALERERYAAAADLFGRAVTAFRNTVGEGDTQLWRAVAALGSAHFHLGDVRGARVEIGHAVERIEALEGADSYELCLPLKELGEVQTAGGDSAAAVATLTRERALEVRLFHGIDHRGVAAGDLLLARALVARTAPGDVREARRLLDEGLGIFARVHPDDALCGETYLLAGRLALAAGGDAERDLARRDLGAAVRVLTRRKGADHADTRTAQRLLNAAGPPASGS